MNATVVELQRLLPSARAPRKTGEGASRPDRSGAPRFSLDRHQWGRDQPLAGFDTDAEKAYGCRELRAGQHLFWAGDAAARIWTVHRGSLKTYGVSGNGEERVTGFFFAGGVIGWEALACGRFQYQAVALEPTTVTGHPVASVLDMALTSTQVQDWLLAGFRSEFVRLNSILWLEHRGAEHRLAAFLLWVARLQGRDCATPDQIELPMSRQDIGSYLGLATETVSRRLATFHRNGWISLRRRRIRVLDAPHLRRLAEN